MRTSTFVETPDYARLRFSDGPTVAEVGQLWRAAYERRRSGGFVPLSPSEDEELAALARPPHPATAAAAAAMEVPPPTAHDLLGDWLARGDGATCVDEACIAKRWDAMLCAE